MYTTKLINIKVFLYYFGMTDSGNDPGIMNPSPRVVFHVYFIYYLVAYFIYKLGYSHIPFLSHFQIQSLFAHNHCNMHT